MIRTILHFDLDAFFCAVEEALNPALRGKAFVVGGTPGGRGVVTSASYPARKYGVRSAMPTAQALRLCPGLIVVSSSHGVYGEYSRRVMNLVGGLAPAVQQISIDEAFLDVTGDPRSGREIAAWAQEQILKRFEMPTSWGVAPSKLVAKIATEVGKPMGIVVVPAGKEPDFLAPLPVDMLWGVGPKTRERLATLGIRTIGDLTAIDIPRLTTMFGVRGRELATRALGVDERPVRGGHQARSMSAERTFARDIAEIEELRRTLRSLSERVARRLRRDNLAGKTVKLKLRWPDFTTLTRQMSLEQPTDQDGEIFEAVMRLFKRVWKAGRPVRLLGVGVSELGQLVRQLHLFDQSWEQDARLLEALDAIRDKFGAGAIRRADTQRSDRRKDSIGDESGEEIDEES